MSGLYRRWTTVTAIVGPLIEISLPPIPRARDRCVVCGANIPPGRGGRKCKECRSKRPPSGEKGEG